ncbi:Wzz/FepE/Etk N-terminal domain-containing protein [Pseudoalteromonas rhizosphaerae]|uniref:Wzz/FepE/Etk N-terminal domain-containing protein n=1 Tax=Pseudoalteromonas rhizosphaerae TaxID=2518973 RepID=UPI00214774F0|nr:Wzz/FepE/Etk N-terminal domain-containing protein [Pseudoalteromonas rhizosphaerae]
MNLGSHETGDSFFLDKLIRYILSKFLLLAISAILGFGGAAYFAFQQPNIYRAVALLAPSDADKGSSGLSGLSGQLGGLASIAGINLGTGNQLDKTELAIAILESKQFVNEFIQKRNILPDLMAAESWDLETNQVSYNSDIYNHVSDRWLRVVDKPFQATPSTQEAYEVFKNIVAIKEGLVVGTFILSVEHLSPYIAKNWVEWLVEDINENIKRRDLLEANRSIKYLNEQLNQTQITEIRGVLYGLIEEQAKTIMLAQVREEYVFQTIDPALVPEVKYKPRRALICILGMIIGLVFMVLFLIIRFNLKK